ncbi:hypothetical protein, partial [Methylobacterium sp. Leaf456]|uniref:hypothetical protein n=1 Tax=Methylobacterium sp. Leaf456 TaxID=1736382 RepID=UPI001AED0588
MLVHVGRVEEVPVVLPGKDDYNLMIVPLQVPLVPAVARRNICVLGQRRDEHPDLDGAAVVNHLRKIMRHYDISLLLAAELPS